MIAVSSFLAIVGLVCSVLLIKYRERVAEMTGAGGWMDYLGGVYNVIILTAIFIFFFSVATLTGTVDYFLAPVRFLFPNPEMNVVPDMP